MSNHLNIYQMYAKNNNCAGFFVVRNSWDTRYAKIVSIDGKESGELSGTPPYHGNPEVICEIYSSNSHECIKQKEVLSCPGTFGYSLIKVNQ